MTARVSDFDKAHMTDIISGSFGDWFSADLLRLIAKADSENKARLKIAFPDHVQAYLNWVDGGEMGSE